MFLRAFLVLLGGCGAILSNASEAKDYTLAPSTKWVMDYAADSCQLSRAFGTGDDKVIVQFIRYEPGERFDLRVIGQPLGHPFGRPSVRLRFGTAGEFVRTEAMPGTNGKLPALFFAGRLDNLDTSNLDSDELAKMDPVQLTRRYRIAPEAEAAVTSATIRIGSQTVTLQLGSMGPPMAAMRKCTTDLVKLWGLDPAEQEGLASQPCPKTSPARWLRTEDYPSDSLVKGEQALIRFRLMVDATGQATECAIQSALTKGDFAKLSCDLLMRRARLDPALSTNGTPTPSYYVGTVRWIIG